MATIARLTSQAISPDLGNRYQHGRELTPEELAHLLWCYGRRVHAELPAVSRLRDWPHAQQEALASEWSRRLFYHLLIPMLSTLIVRRHGLHLELNQLTLYISSELTLEGIESRHNPTPLAQIWPLAVNRREEMLSTLLAFLENTLCPLITLLAQVTSCRERLLWCNGASYWQWWLQSPELAEQIANLKGASAEEAESRRQIALEFVQQAELPHSRCFHAKRINRLGRNPLYQPLRLRQHDGLEVQVRRVCCQRHQLPTLPLCSSCPLTLAKGRTSRHRQAESLDD